MRARSLYVFILVGALLVAYMGLAQQAQKAPRPPARVAVLNVQRVVQESIMGQRFQKEIEKLQQDQLRKLRQMEQELRQLQQRAQEQASVLSAEASQELSQRIRRKAREIDRFREDALAEVNDRAQIYKRRLETALQPVITEYCVQNGIDIVLDTQVVAFARRTVDITDAIIKRFNASVQSAGKAQ